MSPLVQVGPKYEPPMTNVPCEWHSTPSEGMEANSPESFLWWESLNDPILNSLIQRAASQNLDLQIGASRVMQARLERKGKGAELLPRLDASANYGHVYYNQKTINDILGCRPNHHKQRNLDFFEIGFDAEWEIDLFGAKAHEINAAQARVESTEESLRDVWVTLSAEIARTYIELRGLQERLVLNKKNTESQQETVQLTEQLIQLGTATEIDLKQTEEQLNTLAAQRPLLELAIHKAIHRLSVLLGYAPGELFGELREPQSLPCLPSEKPIGIPSELLRRRPDIRKAERDLAAISENIAIATASLFPRLTLRGFVGDISTQLGSLLNPASLVYYAGPQLLLPIFNSKLIKHDVKFAEIQTQQALYEYQKSVLKALEETENVIASFHAELERNKYLAQAYQSAREANELSMNLYQQGLKDYLTVLLTSRSLLIAEEAYLQSQTELLFHYIALYKALGGEWNIPACQDNQN